jgi:hypothetical protein
MLLMAAMLFVHVAKALHTHTPNSLSPTALQKQIYAKAHTPCSICEFQLAKDTPFTGEIRIQISPAFLSPIYSRLLTAIHADPLFVIDGRGPPAYKA